MRFFARWFLIASLAVATVVLSFVGNYFHGPPLYPDFLDWFSGTIDLFKMAPAPPGTAPWPLKVARFTGAAFTLWALGKLWAQLFTEQIRALRLRCLRGHVVVCGLGRKGAHLAREFRRRGFRVAVAEVASESDDLEACRDEGILVETGDATKAHTLEAVSVEHARFVFAVCRDDHTNLETAMETLARFRARRSAGPLCCYVHLFDLPLRLLLQRHELEQKCPPGFELRLFNIAENTARTLLAEHPLEGRRPSGEKRAHLVVIGLTRLGEAVVTQAARVGHYADLRPLRVTIVDEQAEARSEDFLARQPGLAETCELQILTLRFSESRLHRLEFLGQEAAGEERTLVLCLDEDEANVRLALQLAERARSAQVPILVRLAERRGLARLLAGASEALARKGVSPFGAIEDACAWEVLHEEYLDHLARGFHEHYMTLYGGLPPWEELNEDLRNSNRAAADHIDVKLRAIGCERVPLAGGQPVPPPFEFSTGELDLLARMEHLRWMADRQLAGWTRGPRDNEFKKHPNLVPWKDLTAEDQGKDREQVRHIPTVLAAKGFAIRRVAGAP